MVVVVELDSLNEIVAAERADTKLPSLNGTSDWANWPVRAELLEITATLLQLQEGINNT